MQKDLTKNESIYYGNITSLIQDSTYNTITIEAGKYLKEPIKLELGTVDDYLTTKNGFIDGKVKVGGKEYNATMLDNATVIKNGTLTSINNGATLSITTNSGTTTIETNTGDINIQGGSGTTTFTKTNTVVNDGTIETFSGEGDIERFSLEGKIITKDSNSIISTNAGKTEIKTNSHSIEVSTNSGSVKVNKNLGSVSISDTSQGSLIIENWQIYINENGELLFIPSL